MDINLHNIAYPVRSLGPGKRVAIWVAGCSRNCRGCMTPQLQDSAAGFTMNTSQLVKRLLHLQADLQGVTITGGEPFEQSDAVAEILMKLKILRPRWDILLYSGYRLEEIKKCGDRGVRFLSAIDVLIDGPFKERTPATDGIRGSSNQQIHYLSRRSQQSPYLQSGWMNGNRELGMGQNSFRMLIGVPKAAMLMTVKRKCD